MLCKIKHKPVWMKRMKELAAAAAAALTQPRVLHVFASIKRQLRFQQMISCARTPLWLVAAAQNYEWRRLINESKRCRPACWGIVTRMTTPHTAGTRKNAQYTFAARDRLTAFFLLVKYASISPLHTQRCTLDLYVKQNHTTTSESQMPAGKSTCLKWPWRDIKLQ
jgi:hypothetical protein